MPSVARTAASAQSQPEYPRRRPAQARMKLAQNQDAIATVTIRMRSGCPALCWSKPLTQSPSTGGTTAPSARKSEPTPRSRWNQA